MRVNRIKMRLPKDLSDVGINIPISLTFNPTDQAEIVERDFVEKEMAEIINEVTDYEKARFEPINDKGVIQNKLTYNVNLLNGTTFPSVTTYGDADFTYDDIRFRKSRFKNSFLRLVFYDSDITTNQNVISFITLFSRLTPNDFIPLSTGGVPNVGGGLPKPINQIPIKFVIEEPITNPDGEAEGYHIYNNKGDVVDGLPKYLYMRASWNNAANGKSIPLITDPIPRTIDNLIPKLHMRYILSRDSDGYYYEIDSTYSNNITSMGGDEISVQLYQIQVL